MTKTRSTKRALLLSMMSLILCTSMLIGTTYAWFTDSVSSVNNIITGGNLDVELYWTTTPADDTSWKAVDANTNVFKEDTLWEPGHTEVVYLKVVNEGTLSLKYQLGVNVVSEKAGTNVANEQFLLSNYIKYAVLGEVEEFDTRTEAMDYIAENPVAASGFLSEAYLRSDRLLNKGDAHYATIVVYMPETVGNEANYRVTDTTSAPEINLGLNLMASQYTNEQDSFGKDYDKDAEMWDGAVDTSWYDPEATVYELTTPNQLAGLAKLVDEGNSFEGKIVKLAADIDLESKIFDPIGSYRKDTPFKGTFDGQDHTIFNLSQNTWALDNGYLYGDLGLGLFGLIEDATIKNLTMDGADISGESAIVGIVAGCAYGDCTFEDITVSNSKGADYQYYAGGLVGWASGNHTYKNITVDETTTIGSQWGDFGNASGGIIGGIGSSAEILFEDCVVSCRIDAVNDVVSAYQWYNYRNCGMLIGTVPQVITNGEVQTVKTPENVTCKNVTVIYGDWANYTYCEFAGTGYPFVRVQAGTSVDAYSNVRYGHPTDANGNTVVDDNHVHNEGEEHQLLIAFDQLFGGPANHRYCYYGIPAYDGVTVIYPTTADVFQGAFKIDDGNGNVTDIKGQITNVVFGKTSEYPEIVNNYTAVSNEKGIATYRIPNGTKYDVYYLSETTIMLPKDSNSLFADMSAMTKFDATNLDMSKVENAKSMFVNCANLETIEGIENWDMSNVTNMQSIFYGCNKLNGIDVSKWDTSNVTNMRMVFFRCYALSNDSLKGVENWDVSNVTNFYSMFKHARGLTSLDLSKWDTSSATNMSHMFANISGVEYLDLSGFDTSNVTDMSWMFYEALALKTVWVGDKWTTEAEVSGISPFYRDLELVGGSGTTWQDACDHAGKTTTKTDLGKQYAIVDGGASNPGLLTYKAN